MSCSKGKFFDVDVEYLKERDWYGNPGLDITESPACLGADMIDLSKARGQYPMAAEEFEEFKEVKALAGLTHADNLAAMVQDMEGEFNLFVAQMRKKFGILKSMINTQK